MYYYNKLRLRQTLNIDSKHTIQTEKQVKVPAYIPNNMFLNAPARSSNYVHVKFDLPDQKSRITAIISNYYSLCRLCGLVVYLLQ